jgi:hypothetical protein
MGFSRRLNVAVSNKKKYDSTVFEPVLLMDWAGFEPATSAHQQLLSRLPLFITYLKGQSYRKRTTVLYTQIPPATL